MRNGCSVRTVTICAVALLPVPFVGSGVRAEETIQDQKGLRVGRGPQLFVDDYLIENMEKVTRTFHQARKHPNNPILRGDGPGEEQYAIVYGSVLPKDDEYWMYYYAPNGKPENNWRTQRLAISKDGIHWTKPKLGLIELEGSKENNIVVSYQTHMGFMEGLEPVEDPNPADPEKRYRGYFFGGHWSQDTTTKHKDRPRGIYSAWSADGLHWHCSEEPSPELGHHDRIGLCYDTLRNRWIAFTKENTKYGRERWLSFSPDLQHWTTRQPLLRGTSDRDLYYNNCFVYGNMYLGLLQVFDHNELVLDLHLITSRDGHHWERPEAGRPLLPTGDVGDWDRFNNSPAGSAPLRIGDQLYFYYGGRSYRHGVSRDTLPDSAWGGSTFLCGIGLATLRVDGFASLDSSFDTGVVTTKPLRLPTGQLRVNAKCDFGAVTVEVLDAGGNPLPGYAQADCNVLNADSVDQSVTWKKHQDLAGVTGGRARLRFHLTNARLYSFRVADR